jgi:hypothetical protein
MQTASTTVILLHPSMTLVLILRHDLFYVPVLLF